MKRLFKIVLVVAILPVVAASAFMMNPRPASAATYPYPYDPSDLISNSIFENKSTMSASAIQSFLVSKNSGMQNYKDVEDCGSTSGAHYTYYKQYFHCGTSQLASQIIYDTAQAYSINPQAILATLQKEQSLVTTPNPTSSQLNCAMGYNSCSGYVGFFSQVSAGTWQFRTYIELMEGRNWWGYTPDSYPCKNASANFYSTGLYPGRTVTFYDQGGTAKTVTLANSATAGLYCYTPYVGPISETGYSGSYNFVESFEAWFGSTIYKYAANVTVTTYSDAARTQQLSLSGALPSGKKIYVTVSALNTGSRSWSQSFTDIGTTNPQDRSSIFQDSSWLQPNRAARMVEASADPGQTGTFQFSMTTPNQDGEYHEDFQLVAESRGWMQDNATFGFDITVSNPYNGEVASLNSYRDSAHTLPVDTGALAYGQQVFLELKVKNTGSQSWSNSFVNLGTANPHDRTSAFQDSTWTSSTRLTHLQESSVASGDSGTFDFALTAPSASGDYNESFGIVADGKSWMPAPEFNIPIKVVPAPLSKLYPGLKLYVLQHLRSPNGTYSLAIQNDGNLVIYGGGKPVWASKTAGEGPHLIMQNDGNLVLYGTDGKLIWRTRTGGQGIATLAMQDDGNLVIYAGGKPVWASYKNL